MPLRNNQSSIGTLKVTLNGIQQDFGQRNQSSSSQSEAINHSPPQSHPETSRSNSPSYSETAAVNSTHSENSHSREPKSNQIIAKEVSCQILIKGVVDAKS